MSVLVSCFDRRHSFAAAAALARSGLLEAFYTTIAYCDRWPYRATKMALGPLPSLQERLERHAIPAELADLTIDAPLPGLVLQGISRVPGVRGTSTRESFRVAFHRSYDRWVSRNLRHHDIDVLHAFSRNAATSFQEARRRDVTLVLDQPDPNIDWLLAAEDREREFVGMPPRTISRLERWELSRRRFEYEMAEHILVGLDTVKESFVEYGIDASKIKVVRYGPTVALRARHEAPVADTPFTLLYVGVAGWTKGLHRLLIALDRTGILHSGRVRLIAVGLPQPGWGPYFERQFEQLPNACWIRGMPQGQLMRLYCSSDLLVFPSLVGGIGLAVYEAMASGLAPLVSSGEGVVRDSVNGFVANPLVEGELESALLRGVADRDLCFALGQRAVLAFKDAGLPSYGESLHAFYESIGYGC